MTHFQEIPNTILSGMFVRQLTETLDLNSREQAAANAAAPFTLAAWSLSVLSGGECQLLPHEDDKDAWTHDDSWDLLGRPLPAEQSNKNVIDFQLGHLAQKVDALYQSDKPDDAERFRRLSLAAAGYVFSMSKTPGEDARELTDTMPSAPQVYSQVKSKSERRIVVRTKSQPVLFPLTEPPRNVLNFGPGLTGHTFISEMMLEGENVHLVSGGKGAHFVHRWNDCHVALTEAALNDLKRMRIPPPATLPRGVSIDMLSVPKVHYYEQGMAAAAEQLPQGEELDVAFMSAVHTAGVAECTAGIKLAAERLRIGGLFVLKAPDTSLGDEAGMDKMAYPAMQAFGAPLMAGEGASLGQRYDLTKPMERSASFAIYQKQ